MNELSTASLIDWLLIADINGIYWRDSSCEVSLLTNIRAAEKGRSRAEWEAEMERARYPGTTGYGPVAQRYLMRFCIEYFIVQNRHLRQNHCIVSSTQKLLWWCYLLITVYRSCYICLPLFVTGVALRIHFLLCTLLFCYCRYTFIVGSMMLAITQYV